MFFRGLYDGDFPALKDTLEGVPVVILLDDVAFIIGNEDSGERQGDDESDETEQGSPNGKAEQQDGWVESHGLAHDLWGDDHVDDNLHDDKYGNGRNQDNPEVLPGVHGLEECQEDGRDEGKGMEIGHHVHDADEYAEADSHREIDDGETDTEEDTHGEGHEALAADVTVEGFLHVVHQRFPEGANFFREDAYPVFCEELVVEQDEEHVQQSYQGADNAHDDVVAMSDELEKLWQGLTDTIGKILTMYDVLYLLTVVVDPLLDGVRDAGDMGRLVDVGGHECAEFVELLNHGRYNEPYYSCYDGGDEDERYDDAECTCGHMKFVLHEFDGRVEQVGYEPCNKEGQEYCAEVVDGIEYSEDKQGYECPAYESVEGYFLFKHFLM